MTRFENVFTPLHHEWAVVAESPRARRALRLWAEVDPRLAKFDTVDAAVEAVSTADLLSDRYETTAALLRAAATCPIAERALLQAHIPAVRGLSRRARGWTGERLKVSYGLISEMRAGSVSQSYWGDLDLTVVAAAAEWIRAHVGEDFPTAGLKLRDHCRNRLRAFVWAELRRANAELLAADDPVHCDTNSGLELLELVRSAREQQLISLDDVRLIIGNRFLGVSDREFGQRDRISAATANRRRIRGEQRLALAVA